MSRRSHNPPGVNLSGRCKVWHHRVCKKSNCECHCHKQVHEGFLW